MPQLYYPPSDSVSTETSLHDDDTNPVGPAVGVSQAEFVNTDWMLVQRAGSYDMEARDLLAAWYTDPIRFYCWRLWETRRSMVPRAEGMLDGDDLHGSFMEKEFLMPEFHAKADINRGKYRSYVLGCLKNHVRNELRLHSAKRRGGDRTQVQPGESGNEWETEGDLFGAADGIDGLSPDQAFSQKFLMEAMQRVAVQLESEWQKKGLGEQFAILYPMALRMEDADDLTEQEVAAKLGITRVSVAAKKVALRKQHDAGVKQMLTGACGLLDGPLLYNELKGGQKAFRAFRARMKLRAKKAAKSSGG